MTKAEAPGDQREYPRFRARVPVTLSGLSLFTTNISLSGVQVACPVTLASIFKRQAQGSVVAADFTLPTGAGMHVDCSVAYVWEFDDEYMIGLNFHGLDGAAREALEAYLREAAGLQYLEHS